MMKRFVVAIVLAAVLAFGTEAGAEGLGVPSGTVVLEVTGRIGRTNAPGAARFDLAMLRALGAATIATSTPWTEGVPRFEGVPGRALLEAVGASGTTLVARAINDYAVEIPAEDLRDHGAFMAFAMDGKRLTARDKGPLWILYPFDARPELKAATYFSRSVWQVKSIEVR